jgi:hypothetical protein
VSNFSVKRADIGVEELALDTEEPVVVVLADLEPDFMPVVPSEQEEQDLLEAVVPVT